MKLVFALCAVLVAVLLGLTLNSGDMNAHATTAAEDKSRPGFKFVTCGSVFKLMHKPTGARLHSHEVNYGTGGGSSGQQSVTGVDDSTDTNSNWRLLGPVRGSCPRG